MQPQASQQQGMSPVGRRRPTDRCRRRQDLFGKAARWNGDTAKRASFTGLSIPSPAGAVRAPAAGRDVRGSSAAGLVAAAAPAAGSFCRDAAVDPDAFRRMRSGQAPAIAFFAPVGPMGYDLGGWLHQAFRSRRYRTAPGCSGAVVSLPWLSEARASERHVVLARSRHCRDPFVFCVDGGWVSALQAYRRRINRVEAMVRSNVTVMRMNETAPPNGQLFCCAKVEKTSGPMVWNFGPPRSTGVA